MKLSIIFIIIIMLSGCASLKQNIRSEQSFPQPIGKKVTKDQLSRPEYMKYLTDDVKAVHYAEVCMGKAKARMLNIIWNEQK